MRGRAIGRNSGHGAGLWWLAAVLALCVLASPIDGRQGADLPTRLTDVQFWRLSAELSEPGGYFRSDNLVSNEHTYQYILPALQRQVAAGGVYLGVAPDQNFTYIVASRPRMAFIIDVRRGNLLQHLLYKALIELSADRIGFVSRLFGRARPAGLGPGATVDELFAAFDREEPRDDLYRQTMQAVTDQLMKRHGFPLTPDDLTQIRQIASAFFVNGPALRYSTSNGPGGPGRVAVNFPTFEEVARATDMTGTPRGYLASEEHFGILKDLEERNLIVPVVGNFAGPKALVSVGRYVREHGAVVSMFYVSNVEQYLFQDGLFDDFARNVAELPVDAASTFVRSVSLRFGYDGVEPPGPDGRATALYPVLAFLEDVRRGRLRTYFDLNLRSR
jgi:hypothetical protein